MLPAIIKENDYESVLSQICSSFDRMDELDRAIEWAVVRGIEKGSKRFAPLGGGGYVWRLNSISPSFPPLIVTFFYDEPKTTIYLIALKKVTENS